MTTVVLLCCDLSIALTASMTRKQKNSARCLEFFYYSRQLRVCNRQDVPKWRTTPSLSMQSLVSCLLSLITLLSSLVLLSPVSCLLSLITLLPSLVLLSPVSCSLVSCLMSTVSHHPPPVSCSFVSCLHLPLHYHPTPSSLLPP